MAAKSAHWVAMFFSKKFCVVNSRLAFAKFTAKIWRCLFHRQRRRVDFSKDIFWDSFSIAKKRVLMVGCFRSDGRQALIDFCFLLKHSLKSGKIA